MTPWPAFPSEAGEPPVRVQPVVRPSRPSIVAFVSTGPTVHIGGFLLRELADKSIWLENETGEGMQVRPARLELCLRRFMSKNF